jgi:transaldolase
MKNALEHLKTMTEIVADTGDAKLVRRYQPLDCTTNPSLVLAALTNPESADLVAEEVSIARSRTMDAMELCNTMAVALGANLASLISGRVSTEVDARLSFDVEQSFRRANEIVTDYDRRGVGSDRILIKLAATWEGIRAAELLERRGIKCNLTLLFSLTQAKACADAGVYLISPFVGRITDWYKKATGTSEYSADDDPGVKSVKEIFSYYKSQGIKTIVMGASFRSTDQLRALAGCDRLTISPSLLDALCTDFRPMERQLHAAHVEPFQGTHMAEPQFRWDLNENPMASEKLSEGIRGFDADHRKLLDLLKKKMFSD